MENKETIKIQKLTKYGFKLNNGELVYATPEVMNYVSKSIPCEIEVLETKPYGKSGKQITKVKIKESNNSKSSPVQEIRPKVDAGNTLSLAVDLYKLDKTKSLHSICEELVNEFKFLEEALK